MRLLLGLALCFFASARIPYDEYVRDLVPVKASLNCSRPLNNAVMPPNFCVQVFASGLSGARGVFIADNNDVLVESGGSIIALWDGNMDGVPEGRVTLASAPGLNHGVYVYKNYLYATSMTTCYRWRYPAGQRTNLGAPEVVVKNIPANHHVTRVIVFDDEGRLYVHCGSEANVARDDSHSRIHRFNLNVIPSGGIDWTQGEYFAGGLRNENGLRFDEQQRLWGVENGRDDLNRADLGGDIHNDNPGEELNMFDKNTPGKYYGYPRCWSVFNLTYQGRTYPSGTQFADPGFMPATTDAWCQNTANVVPPSRVMDAHMAPLDILFWPTTERTWPNYGGDAFVAYHGSWDRNPPSGYLVEHITFQNGRPVANAPFLGYRNAPYSPPSSWIRPVGLGKYKCIYGQCLIVSSDATGQLLIVSYSP